MSVRLRAVPGLLVLAVVLGGCRLPTGGHAAPSDAPSPAGTSGVAVTRTGTAASAVVGPATTTTAQAIHDLASVGIATVSGDSPHASERPLAPVTSPQVSTLLLSQVRGLAGQASAGGGSLGSDLDSAFPLGDDAPTFTQIIGAWIVSAPDDAARTAGRLVGTADWTRPETVVLPTEVVDLFVADLTQSVVEAQGASPTAEPSSGGSGAGIPLLDTPCTSLRSFVSDQVDSIFEKLHVDPLQVQAYIEGHVGGFAGTLLGWLGRLGSSIVDGLVDILHATVEQVVDAFTDLVISRLQVVLGSVYAVLQITQLFRTHTVQVAATPTANQVAVGDEPDRLGAFTASVPDNDETAGLPTQVVDCANFAHIHPPTVTRAGAAVHWTVTDGAHTVEVTSPGGRAPTYDDVMGTDVTSTLRYRTARVASRTGQEYVAPVEAAVSVQRTEVKDLRDMLDAALGANLGLLAPFARAIVHPLLDIIEGKLPLTRIEGRSVIPVRFWGDKPPSSSTPDCPAGRTIPSGTYVAQVHALIHTHELVTLQGQRLLAASAENLMTGQITVTSDGSKVSGSVRLSGTSEGTGAADIGVPLRVHSVGSVRGPISGSAGDPHALLTLTGSYTDNDPLGGQHSGSSATTQSAGLHVVAANCVSVTGDVAALFRELIDRVLSGQDSSAQGHVAVTVSGNGTWVAEKTG